MGLMLKIPCALETIGQRAEADSQREGEEHADVNGLLCFIGPAEYLPRRSEGRPDAEHHHGHTDVHEAHH